jgi:hypothetical protein
MFGHGSIIEALYKLRSNSRMARWYQHHKEREVDGLHWEPSLLDDFLFSTVDEVRSRNANKLAQATLTLQFLDEITFFRESVLRREAGGDIANPGQRDHTAHTVNNWLLGWLIYEHSEQFRGAFKVAAQARGLLVDGTGKTIDEEIAFGNVWIYASLLHDIGYLFEGAIEAMSWRADHAMAHQAIIVVRDLWQNQVWPAWGLRSLHHQRIAKDAVASWFRSPPRDNTLISIIEELRTLGDLQSLLRDVDLPSKVLAELPRGYMDAFDLWHLHYAQHSSGSMLEHVDYVRDASHALAVDGLPGDGMSEGMRLIDHGVAGGLMILQVNTLYFAALRELKILKPNDWEDDAQWRAFKGATRKAEFFTRFWWSGIVWASFATAFHNVQQLRQSARSDRPESLLFRRAKQQPLALDDDPLSYLGILVDILQEWDRYQVARTGHVLGRVPLQGVDVRCEISGGRLRLDLSERRVPGGGDRNEKAQKALSAALRDWEALVSLVRLQATT